MRRHVAVKSIAKRFEYFELGKSPKRRKKKKEKKKEQEVEEEEKQEAVQRGFAFDAFGATSERNLSRFRERDVIRAIHMARTIAPNPSALLRREAHDPGRDNPSNGIRFIAELLLSSFPRAVEFSRA